MLRAIKLLSTAGVAAYSTSSTQAADKFIKAWASKQWISNPSDFPPPPASVAEMYETHLAIQSAADQFGGLGGYKIGAVGAEGEPCLYGPLFSNFIVEAAGRPNASPLSSSSINLFQIEPEFALVMGEDVKPRSDGLPHTADNVWAAVASVVLCIECCGRRGTKEVAATIPNKLGRFNDALCAGGVVLGERRAAKYFNADSLKAAQTELVVNGESVVTGSGAALPFDGDVKEELAWLANHLEARGLGLEAGMVIATGQTCAYNGELKEGDEVVARFEPALGEVRMRVEQ